jgi:putative nucleotidyltransferase with HDIG domain
MDVRTLSGVASHLGSDVPTLRIRVIDILNDPALISSAGLDVAVDALVDRLCFSMQMAKAIGLATWAEREGRRLGRAYAAEIAAATTHVIATEAKRFDVDHARVLTFLEVLKSEIDDALSSLDGESPDKRRQHTESTEALLAMLGERDAATCCHSKATGEWARRLATALGLSPEATSFVELCAVLHDIGKISTPDAILFKEGSLTGEEWEIMRDHAAAGQRILSAIPSLQRCAMIVRAHHERWDGKGYPDGLSGTTVPIEARLIAVADAFHAMISDRPYRKAMPPRRALEILRDGRGTQWDPQMVDAMLSLFERGAARKPADKQASSA